MSGLSTCLVLQNQDPTADYLLNCKIGTSPIVFNDNLSAVRLETTKVRLPPYFLILSKSMLYIIIDFLVLIRFKIWKYHI